LVFAHENASSAEIQVRDIAFVAHHAIADGLSAVAFHKTLLKIFFEASLNVDIPSWPYIVPSNTTKALPLEDALIVGIESHDESA